MLENNCADNQRDIVSTNSINSDKFKEIDRKKKFSQAQESKPRNF